MSSLGDIIKENIKGSELMWNYEENLRRIEKTGKENWEYFRYGKCESCGKITEQLYDLCENCEDADLSECAIRQITLLFKSYNQADISEYHTRMCQEWPDGDPHTLVAEFKDFCYSAGRAGKEYYLDQKRRADRSDATPGSPSHLLKIYG